MEILRASNQRSMQGLAVHHLEIGEPGGGPPQVVMEAAAKALRDGQRLGYLEARGDPALIDALCTHHQTFYNQNIHSTEIMVTAGASAGLILAFLAAFDVGDRIGVCVPGYPAYVNTLTALGLTIVYLPVDETTQFIPTTAMLEAAGPLDGLLLGSPANPTGITIPEDKLRTLCHWCTGHQVRLVSDEIYHGITFGHRAFSAREFSDSAIIVNSFSKYFAMTGFRLGWMVAPEDVIRQCEKLGQILYIAPAALSQHAARAAFSAYEELDARVQRYARNRDRLASGLPDLGVDIPVVPDGAFYLYCPVHRFTDDSESYCRHILEKSGVALAPGTDFDQKHGHSYIRFSYAGAEDSIDRALTALADDVFTPLPR